MVSTPFDRMSANESSEVMLLGVAVVVAQPAAKANTVRARMTARANRRFLGALATGARWALQCAEIRFWSNNGRVAWLGVPATRLNSVMI